MELRENHVRIADGARITRDGYLVGEALVGRANNIQSYSAGELGLTDRDPQTQVRVFRPESEVFARDALASLAHRPITIGHPSSDVRADNWRAHAVGDVGDEVIRDGERVRVPFKIMDANAIDAIRTTHQEFSLGYALMLDMTPGEHDGQSYDAVARSIRYNHLAAVRAARGGPELRIIDERPGKDNPMKIRIGDAEVDATNAEAVRVAVEALDGKYAALQTQVGSLTAELATAKEAIQAKDGEIAGLNAKIADSVVTPEKLQQLADARADTISRARTLKPDLVTDGKTDAEIRKEAVTAKLGDAATGMADAAIDGAFVALTRDAKPDDGRVQPIHAPASMADADETVKAYDAMVSELVNAWKPKQAA